MIDSISMDLEPHGTTQISAAGAYGTAELQAEVLPDSKPSLNIRGWGGKQLNTALVKSAS